MLLDQNGLFIFNLSTLHQQDLALVLFFSLHFENLRPQLVYDNLLLVQFLLKLLDALHLLHCIVRSFTLLHDLRLVRLLHLFLLIFLCGDEDLVASDFLSRLLNLILRNDQVTVGLALAMLQLTNMRLKLLNNVP